MVRQLAAYVAGSVGQGMPFVVIAVEFTRRDLPDAWLASVAMARIVPYVVCSPVAGVVAGRCRLGRVVTASAVARFGLTVLMLSFLHAVPAWAAVALLVLIGVAGTPCYPALMAGLRDTVAEPQREPWGRHIVVLESVAFSAGPALAGALVVVEGTGCMALVVAITLFAVAAVIALGAIPSVGPPGRGAPSDLRLALGALVHPALRSSVAALLVVNVLGGAAMALLPAIAREVRHQHDGLLGWLTASQGVGALAVVAGGSAVATAVGISSTADGHGRRRRIPARPLGNGPPGTRRCRLCPVRRRRGDGRGRRIDGAPAATPSPGRQRHVRAARLAPDRGHGRRRPCRPAAGHHHRHPVVPRRVGGRRHDLDLAVAAGPAGTAGRPAGRHAARSPERGPGRSSPMRARRRNLLAAVLAAACLTSACTEPTPGGEAGTRLHDPVAVIERWNDTRNHGDVAGALALLADDATVLGFRLDEPGDRAELAEILAAQAEAGFHLTDHACEAAGSVVTCDYDMDDEVMRRWNLALHGVHRYEVVDGRITAATRTHDRSSSDRVYRELEAFRRWVTERHPDLVEVIWSTPGAAAYTTVLGARTMLSLLDEYQNTTTGGSP